MGCKNILIKRQASLWKSNRLVTLWSGWYSTKLMFLFQLYPNWVKVISYNNVIVFNDTVIGYSYTNEEQRGVYWCTCITKI